MHTEVHTSYSCESVIRIDAGLAWFALLLYPLKYAFLLGFSFILPCFLCWHAACFIYTVISEAATTTGVNQMNTCTRCGGEISAERDAKVQATRAAMGKPARPTQFCDGCMRLVMAERKRERARLERNANRRAENEILRELCGTSARAARLDMGL